MNSAKISTHTVYLIIDRIPVTIKTCHIDTVYTNPAVMPHVYDIIVNAILVVMCN